MKYLTKQLFFSFFLLCFLVFNGYADQETKEAPIQFSVNASVDHSLITIGEKIKLNLTVIYPEDYWLEQKAFANQLGGFAIRDYGEEEKNLSNNIKQKSFWYILDTYLVGAYVIPEMEFKIFNEAKESHVLKSSEIFIEVKSVIADDDQLLDIKQIKDQEYVKDYAKWFIVLLTIGTFVLGVYLVCLLIKYFRSRTKPEIALSPAELAERELNDLADKNYLNEGKYREFYFDLTTCLRAYIERKFSIPALEATTEEFVERMMLDNHFTAEQNNLLKKFLSHCDFVKFAKYTPNRVEAKEAHDYVKDFIASCESEDLEVMT